MTQSCPASSARLRSLGAPVLLIAGVLATGIVSAAGATTLTWNNAAGGLWSDAANWSPNEVPDAAGESAVLPALSGAYQVTLDISPAIDALQIDASDPTLDLNGNSVASVGLVTNRGTIQNFVGAYDSNKLRNLSGGTVVVTPDHVLEATGTLWNDGTIVIGPGYNSKLYSPNNLTLDGAGTIILDETTVSDPTDHSLTIGANATLRGTGVIVKKFVTNYGTLECDDALIRIDGIVYNYGVIRSSNAGTVNVNRPLVKNRGTISSGAGGGTFSILMPYDVGGTLDNTGGGTIVAGGSDLGLWCGTLMEGTFQRTGGAGTVNVGIATMQNMTVAAGAEMAVTGHADLMASGTTLTNNGTVRISGSVNFGIWNSPDSIYIGGNGVVILEGGILGSGTGGILVNRAGQTIQGCGTINPPFVNNGTVNFDCGNSPALITGNYVNRRMIRVSRGRLKVSGATTLLSNRGTMLAQGGAVVVEKGATIDNSGGAIVANSSTVSLGGTTSATVVGGRLDAVNEGLYHVQKAATLRDVKLGPNARLVTTAGATTTAGGARFLNHGMNRIEALGAFVVGPMTEYVQTAGATVLDGGAISSVRDLQIQGGRLSGSGTIAANVVNAGVVSPEAGAGSLHVHGNYSQLSAGTFEVALGGVAAAQNSRLEVSGTATLDGALATSLLAGFSPGSGASFDVLSSGVLSGQFGQFVAGTPRTELDVTPVYGQASVALVVNGSVGVNDGVNDRTGVPASLRFYGRRGVTGASFVLELPRAAELKARVYDAAGREIARLADGVREAGVHVLSFDGPGGARGLSSGMYFAQIAVTSEGVSEVRRARVIVLR